MIQVDLPAAFAVGQVYAFLSQTYLRGETRFFTSRPLGMLNLYLSCGFVPGGLYLLSAYPAWEAMYTTGWLDAPFDNPPVAFFTVLFVMLMVLLGNAGYVAGHWCYRNGKDRTVLWGIATAIFLTVLPFFLDWGVWMRVGTYDEVMQGGGYSFWEPPFFYGWAIIMSWLTLSTLAAGIWFKKVANAMK